MRGELCHLVGLSGGGQALEKLPASEREAVCGGAAGGSARLRRGQATHARSAGVLDPSHLTCAEFEAKGHPRHAWSGNNAADEAAKERASVAIAPDELVERVLAHRTRAKEVAHVVASAQLQRLQQRIRTEGGAAVKARKRRAPGGLRRLRAPGAK